jgi:hypothetical protein
MFVDDHVDAIRALQDENADGELFNVSPRKLNDQPAAREKAGEIIGFKGRIVEGSYPPGYPIRPANLIT